MPAPPTGRPPLLTLVVATLRREGLVHGTLRIARKAIRRGLNRAIRPELYDQFVHQETVQRDAARPARLREIAGFRHRPLISIVLPAYNTPRRLLRQAIESVEKQIYPDWELIVVDDGSRRRRVRAELALAARRDLRVRPVFRRTNGNISVATNDGLRAARGEFVAFFDHDDCLSEDALFHVVRTLNDRPDADLIYSDSDKLDAEGRRVEPFFKPDWSPEFFRGVMYLGHLLVVRKTLLDAVGGCDPRFDGIQDYELALRLTERTDRIVHIPRVLYHWRAAVGSLAAASDAKPRIDMLQAQAVQEQVDRQGIPATAVALGQHRVRLVPRPRDRYPRVSVMIPTRDRPELIGRCLDTLFAKTSYPNLEVIVGDNETADPVAQVILDRYPVRRVPLPGAFHFARFNNSMARTATGEFLLLLNNDTEILETDWLQHLLLHADRPDAGAAGPLLLYPDQTVQHAGVILGPRGTADHVLRGLPATHDGYAGSLRCNREVTAVTGACLLVSRENYWAVGGLDELFRRHYEDVDFCLKLRARGLRNVYVASTSLIHHESKSRGSIYDYTDRILLLDRWEGWVDAGDPYYNPHFEPTRHDYTVRVQGVAA